MPFRWLCRFGTVWINTHSAIMVLIMNEAKIRLAAPDLSHYHENRLKFPAEELAQYAGQYVAFSPEGTHILACGSTEEEVEKRLEAAGIDPSQVVGSYVPAPDEIILL
jgi:hypothetical protein